MELRIRELLTAQGMNQRELAERSGMSTSYLSEIINGHRRINATTLQRLANGLGVEARELISDATRLVSIVGKVGAGSEVFPIDDYPLGSDQLPQVVAPSGLDPATTAAVEVTGDSWEPIISDGWILFYSRAHEGVTDDEVNHLCVVKRRDGAMFVKKLLRGSKPGLFTLISSNAAPMLDQKIEWAARIKHFVSPDQALAA